jgi:hypothetical protein
MQPDKPAAPQAEAPPAAPVSPSAPPPRLGWGWRLVLFLWITSFVSLLLYEFLAAILKLAGRLFTS